MLCYKMFKIIIISSLISDVALKQPSINYLERNIHTVLAPLSHKVKRSLNNFYGGFHERYHVDYHGGYHGYQGYHGSNSRDYPRGYSECSAGGYPGIHRGGFPVGFHIGYPGGYHEGYHGGYNGGYPGGYNGYPGEYPNGYLGGYPGDYHEGSSGGYSRGFSSGMHGVYEGEHNGEYNEKLGRRNDERFNGGQNSGHTIIMNDNNHVVTSK